MTLAAFTQPLDLSRVSSTRIELFLVGVLAARDEIDQGPARRGRGYRKRVGRFQTDLIRELQYVWVEVQGSRRSPYDVSIEFAGGNRGGLEAVCSCPYSGGVDPCKHTWAALDQLAELLTGELQARAGSAAPQSVGRAAANEPAWQRGLHQLDRFLSLADPPAVSESSEEAQRRVVWRVGVSAGYPHVQAFEQRLRKRGSGYTKGSRLSLERLLRSRELWSRPDVRAVAQLIEEEEAYGYYRGGYSVDYVLDHGKALQALIGSQHVYWLHDPRQRVVVRRGKLALSLRPRGKTQLELVPTFGGRPLRSFPEPSRSGGTQLLVAADTQEHFLTVGTVEGEALQLVAGLDDKARVFPKKSHAALLERLERLEGLLPVHVPEELQGAPRDGDARLRLLLTPSEQGLSISTGVRPAGRGSLLVPGAEGDVCAWVDGKRVPVRRDRQRERSQALQVLSALGLSVVAGLEDLPSGWSWQVEGEAALELVSAIQATDPTQLVAEWPKGERLSVSRPLDSGDLRVNVSSGRDWFGLDASIEVDGLEVPLARVLEGLRLGERFVPLDGGRFLQLSRLLRERLSALSDVVHTSGKRVEVGATAGPLVQELIDDAGKAEVCESWQELQARLKKARRVSTKPPRGLKAELRPYQQEGVAWLKRLATWGVGACLADDMGLGKTVQAIALLVARARLGPALVVAPTSVGSNWKRELQRFAPRLRPLLYRETDRSEVLETLGARDVVIVSYDMARLDIEGLEQVAWGSLVFDEAQQVKNGTTKTARALRRLQGGWRLALTGTPIENHLGELWSLFRLISPGVFGGWESFKRRFAAPIERDGDAGRREALARVIQPFILRRTKGEVLSELPGRTDVQLDVELSKREQRLYEEARLTAVAELATGDGRDQRFRVLAALTQLRQLACHPRLVDASWEQGSAKLSAFLEIVEELRVGGHRALVFSQFTRHLGLLREALDEQGVSYLYLDGKTPARKRQKLVDAFQAGEGELFLISLKAGGKGLNLTGADYVVHLDPWWNPAVEDQATDRAHRIGQTKPVTVYRLVAKDTIEEKILALHRDKRDLVAGVLDGTDRAGKLSTDELVSLIKDGGASGKPVRRRLPPALPAPTEPTPTKSAAARLFALRERLTLTQSELGLLLGVKASTVCRWERGTLSLPLRRMAMLEKVEALSSKGVQRRLRKLASEA